MTPLERSTVYGGFAAAFRSADGGQDVLDETIVPPAPQDGAQAFMATFDPSVAKTAISLHASAHFEREQTDLYQELIRWYAHFGLKRRDGGELPDHLCFMLEFMQFLTTQEQAHAADASAVANSHTAQRDFIERHLLPLAEALERGVSSTVPRYQQLPSALKQFLHDELQAL